MGQIAQPKYPKPSPRGEEKNRDTQFCKYLYEDDIKLIRKACNIAIHTDMLTDREKEDLERLLECGDI